MKKEERVESFVDDEVENRGNADLDEILAVLQNPSSHFGTGQTLRDIILISWNPVAITSTCILKKSDWLRPSSMLRSFRKSCTVSSHTYLFFLLMKNSSDCSLDKESQHQEKVQWFLLLPDDRLFMHIVIIVVGDVLMIMIVMMIMIMAMVIGDDDDGDDEELPDDRLFVHLLMMVVGE